MSRTSSSRPGLLLVLLVLALLAPACGADEDATTATTGPPPTATTGPPPTATTTDAAADATIVPGEGMAGIAVGDMRADVEGVLGSPADEREVPNELSGGTNTVMEYDDVQVTLSLDEVLAIETTSAGLATPDGLAVGSSRDEVVAAHPDARCDTGEIAICRVGTEQAGAIVTDYFIQAGAVTRINIGRIVD